MNPENFCASYDQCLRLRELGIDQRAYFWHHFPIMGNENFRVVFPYASPGHTIKGCEERRQNCAAFNVAELGMMLGHQISRISQQPNGIYLILEQGLKGAFFMGQKYEAHARAELLIYILDHKYMTAEEINNRLKTA